MSLKQSKKPHKSAVIPAPQSQQLRALLRCVKPCSLLCAFLPHEWQTTLIIEKSARKVKSGTGFPRAARLVGRLRQPFPSKNHSMGA